MSGVIAGLLYALLTWLVDDDPVTTHILEIIAIGVAFFMSSFFAARRAAAKNIDDRS